MKVVLITTGQPSLNPRLVKEADALADAGYDVTVLYAYWNDWGTAFDKQLIPQKKWKAICVGGDPDKDRLTYFVSRVIHKIARWVNQKSGGKYLLDFAISRAGHFLSRKAKKYIADIYIGHNLGALPATVKAAGANKKPCGFDAEDFHRFEVSNDANHYDVLLKTRVENKYLPRVAYFTAGSPLIGNAYQQLFPVKEPVSILNVFPNDWSIKEPVENSGGPVRLLWFSQTIGTNRGLEDVLKALSLLNYKDFELHLLGYLAVDTKRMLIDNLIEEGTVNIHIHEPIPSEELTQFASAFDIGLALEPGFSINNNYALSNKIFTYLQAGLAVIASDTDAQLNFINEYPDVGKVYPKGNFKALADILMNYNLQRQQLFEKRKAAFALARQKLNWENESKKFLDIVKQAVAAKPNY